MPGAVAAALFAMIAPGAQAEPADSGIPEARPVPRFQAIPLPGHAVSLQRDAIELTRLHFARDQDRPFLYPITLGRPDAPAVSLTRMGHPHDPVTHSHHNSVWIAHHNVDGVDFWSDLEQGGTGRIRQYRVERLFDGDRGAGATILSRWTEEATGRVLLDERRTIRAVPANDDPASIDWLLLIDLELAAPDGRESTTIQTTPFGLIGVRLAKTIGVHDGGGRILNSEGDRNEEAVFRKPARWVDYSGPLTRESSGGITLLDHPRNPGHPTAFHIRNDGWMGACLTLDRPIRISGDPPLQLRYGLWIHAGVPDRAACQVAWDRFARTPDPPSRHEKP